MVADLDVGAARSALEILGNAAASPSALEVTADVATVVVRLIDVAP